MTKKQDMVVLDAGLPMDEPPDVDEDHEAEGGDGIGDLVTIAEKLGASRKGSVISRKMSSAALSKRGSVSSTRSSEHGTFAGAADTAENTRMMNKKVGDD